MQVESEQDQDPSPSRRYRGPQGLGEAVARIFGERAEAGESVGRVEEEAFLKQWFGAHGGFLSLDEWERLILITDSTAEHEVRFRDEDARAVKRTLPGTFGNVPKPIDGEWVQAPTTPSDYLLRLALQNQFFDDALRLEGAML
ncbi:MAG: hypothetical protein WD342_15570 [Verrucomicrobiales bacterium]